MAGCLTEHVRCVGGGGGGAASPITSAIISGIGADDCVSVVLIW